MTVHYMILCIIRSCAGSKIQDWMVSDVLLCLSIFRPKEVSTEARDVPECLGTICTIVMLGWGATP